MGEVVYVRERVLNSGEETEKLRQQNQVLTKTKC